jgi:hypothetical protein
MLGAALASVARRLSELSCQHHINHDHTQQMLPKHGTMFVSFERTATGS